MNAILQQFYKVAQLDSRFPLLTDYNDEIHSQDIDALNDIAFVLCQDHDVLEFMSSVSCKELWHGLNNFISGTRKKIVMSIHSLGNASISPYLISATDFTRFSKLLERDPEQYIMYRDIYFESHNIFINQNIAVKMLWGPVTADSSYLVDMCTDAYSHSLKTEMPLLTTVILVERLRSLIYKLYFKSVYDCELQGIVFEEEGCDYIPDRLLSCVLYRRATLSQALINLNYVGPDYNIKILRSNYEDIV